MADSKKNIYETIIAVMNEIGVIGKDKKNKQQGFMYRGVDDVMNALNPVFIKHKLFMVPEVLEQKREERQTRQGGNLIYSVCRVKYTFYAEDGSSIQTVIVGEGMDSGDKASNKALAVAFKYACFQTFCIPTEEIKDPEQLQDPDQNTPPPTTKVIKFIDAGQKKAFLAECERVGQPSDKVLKVLKLEITLDKMTLEQYEYAMNKLAKTKSKAVGEPIPQTIPPETVDSSLPWNTPER